MFHYSDMVRSLNALLIRYGAFVKCFTIQIGCVRLMFYYSDLVRSLNVLLFRYGAFVKCFTI